MNCNRNTLAITIDAKLLEARTRMKGRFNCVLCGKDFKVGDPARWIYANGTPNMNTGNFFICGECDKENESNPARILANAKTSFQQACELGKRWGIYGPDWQKDWQHANRCDD